MTRGLRLTEEQYAEASAAAWANNAERRPVLKLKPCVPLEADIQPNVLKALLLHPRVAWAARINTGAGKLIYPDGSLSRFMRFGFSGCADNIGQLVDGRFLACEVKRPGEAPTEDQQAFLDRVNRHGGKGFVARNVADVWRELGTA